MELQIQEIRAYLKTILGENDIVSVSKGGRIVRKNCFTINIMLSSNESAAFLFSLKNAIEKNLEAKFDGRTVKVGKQQEKALFFVPMPY